MGLKDLVAQKAALTEEAIEVIIGDYVRYDTDVMEIAKTPEFAILNNKAKILVYLVALQGWPFVTDDAIATSAKPAVLEDELGIPGGTLRPVLKGLKDGHLVAVKKGAYSVRASHLESVNAEIVGASSQGMGRRKTTSRKKAGKRKAKKVSAPNSNKGGVKHAGLGDMFEGLVAEGFFDDGKTAKDVQERFHEETVMIATSVLPPYFIRAVSKDKTLVRKKEDVGGRMIWVYRTKK